MWSTSNWEGQWIGGICRIVPRVVAETFEALYCTGVSADLQEVSAETELCRSDVAAYIPRIVQVLRAYLQARPVFPGQYLEDDPQVYVEVVSAATPSRDCRWSKHLKFGPMSNLPFLGSRKMNET